jgi:hypothetical protein
VATPADDLAEIRANLIAIVKAQTAAWVTAGCPPTFSVDGESYDWNNWLTGKLAAIKDLTEQVQGIGPRFIVRSRGRA